MSDSTDKTEQQNDEEKTSSKTSQAVEGKITADEKSGYISTLAAYTYMIKAAEQIATKVKELLEKESGSKILIVDSLDLSGQDIQFHQVDNQLKYWLEVLKNQIEIIENLLTPHKVQKTKESTQVETKQMISTTPITTVLQSLADIVGFFKVDYDIKGQTFDLSNIALRTLVAGKLIKEKKFPVYFPSFYRINDNENLEIIQNFGSCITYKNQLKNLTDKLKSTLTSEQTTKKKKSGMAAQKEQIGQIETECKNAENLISDFASFIKEITSPPEKGGNSPIANAIRHQYMDKKNISHLLYVEVVSGGGEMVIGKGLFRWGKVGYLGGCVISYVLADRKGEIVVADVNCGYSQSRYNLCRNKLEEFQGKVLSENYSNNNSHSLQNKLRD